MSPHIDGLLLYCHKMLKLGTKLVLCYVMDSLNLLIIECHVLTG